MNEQVLDAYNSLIPADRTIVDAMIFTLANKDRQISSLCKAVNEQLHEKGNHRCNLTRAE